MATPELKQVRACVAVAAPAANSTSLHQLLVNLRPDGSTCYLVVAHPREGVNPASLVEKLGNAGGPPVRMAAEGSAIEPDVIYVADDRSIVTVEDGILRLRPTTPNDGRVDSLLLSVTEAYEERAIIVVLAHLGLDGTAGVAATKRCGGIAIAEELAGAPQADGPPISAAVIADLCVPVKRIPHEIHAYVANLVRTGDGVLLADKLQEDVNQQIARIAAILRNTTGNDFHGYKHATFLRRIQRRMQVVQIDDVERYIERLRSEAGEVQHLFQDLLIGVTQFFRDSAEFTVLERDVIPRIFDGRGADDRVRVWVLGCASGEEAYSLAILLRERMASMDIAPHAQIFATDIDTRALAVARSGRYGESIARHVSPERLARWFIKEGTTYSVVKELREMCIFSPHNLIRDAPFSRIDLLSCRNLLIYLNGDLQDRVIPIFHFSLRAGGYLFLGPAENITRHQNLFSPVDRRNRIFKRVETSTRVLHDFPLSAHSDQGNARADAGRRGLPAPQLTARAGRRVEQVAEQYAPAYVVLDGNYDVLHFSGRTGRFLEPSTGAASLNLLNLVHRDLRLDLRPALHKAQTENVRTEVRNVRTSDGESTRISNIVVEPLGGPDDSGTLIVFFQDVGPASGAQHADPGIAIDEHVQRLENDLRITKERLQTTIEELESTNEELKSSNEEYQSINEELQSANEELETSKEELQAVNEELQTVNGELANRVNDLARSNSDLKNLLESTQIATVFLDNELRLRSFTPAASDVFHLIDADFGRPIAHVTLRVRYPELLDDARRVLKSLGQVERQVTGLEEERTFLVRVLPYRSVDNFIAGVVVTFLEITSTVAAEAALRISERRFAEAQRLASVGVWESNLDTGEEWWSPGVYQLWGLTVSDVPPPLAARPIHPDDRDNYEAALRAARETGELKVEWRVLLPDGTSRWLAETGRVSSAGRLLGITQDISERKHNESRLTLLLGELQHRVRNILSVVRSLASRTLSGTGTVEDLAMALDGRLQTLARAQNVFINQDVKSIELEELVREEIAAVATLDGQCQITGPTIRLKRDSAQTIALALHELATNAVKHGALSAPQGKLAVSWNVFNTEAGRRLSLEWKESGMLNGVPHRKPGFGTELIEKGLPFQLKAMTAIDFEKDGLRSRIEFPLTHEVADLDSAERSKQH